MGKYAKIHAICMICLVVLGTIAVAAETLMILFRMISYFN